MKAKATAFKRHDLRDFCGLLNLKAENEEEASWLSALYKLTLHGGTMSVVLKNGEATKVEFGD